MPTAAETFDKNFRDANMLMLDAFNKQHKESIFGDITQKIVDPAGYQNFAVSLGRARFELLEDEVKPISLDARKLLLETQVYKSAVTISAKRLRQAKALAGDSEIMMQIRAMADDAIQLIDEALTTLLEANGNDVLASAFFASAAVVPNSRAGATFTNLFTGSAPTDYASMREWFYDLVALLSGQMNTAGRRMHPPSIINTNKLKIMFPTAMQSLLEETFAREYVSGGTSNEIHKRVTLVHNPYLQDAGNMYPIVPNPTAPAFAHLENGPVELEEAGSESFEGGRSRRVSTNRLLRDVELFGARYEFNVGYLDRTGIAKWDPSN